MTRWLVQLHASACWCSRRSVASREKRGLEQECRVVGRYDDYAYDPDDVHLCGELRRKSTSTGRRAEPKRGDSSAAFKATRNKGCKRTKRESRASDLGRAVPCDHLLVRVVTRRLIRCFSCCGVVYQACLCLCYPKCNLSLFVHPLSRCGNERSRVHLCKNMKILLHLCSVHALCEGITALLHSLWWYGGRRDKYK